MLEVPTAPTSTKKPPAILSLIGETPLVEITQFDTGPCQLFLKLENQNPTGSIKDRIALSMIEAAEEEGKLEPGGTVIEATAGNTGLGLALVAAAKGYHVVLVIPDKMSQEKISHVRALGAEVRLTRSDVTRGHPEYYQDVAARLADEIPGAFYVNQFGNPANPLAHERTTGPEIWEQMRHDVDAIVCGVGSGGTLTGLGRFFNRVKPRRGIEMVLADPTGSVLYEYVKSGKLVEAGSWAVEGIGEDFIPEIADMSLVTDAFEIDDEESFAIARDLLRKEGIFGGSSTGTLVAGALRYCRQQTQPKRVVSFVADTGNKYLSKMYNDFWMAEQGFIHRAPQGDLNDLISHRYEAGEVISVGPTDTLLTAFKRMRDADVSQLPVVDQSGRAMGILDESDVLVKVHRDSGHFNDPVKDAMTDRLETLPPNAKFSDLLEVFDRGRVAIVMDSDKFLGLITRTDLLSYLRLNMPKSSVPPQREYN
ncbi:MAG: cystathionine beta-synthase [Verrucomicrobia bacterium]|nr:MAG: cystathionine beta-synthase [Verrucomicrobiota bacterium]PYL93780.1 MAG: cystathionine beta-synthase [Verrucomicrobiota bacterium]